jgi:hypothetical protein
VRNDNLVILDATRSRTFEQARDEMEIFAGRNARMLLVSQRALYASLSERKVLAGCNAGDPVLLPSLKGGPIPDLLLPFVCQLLAVSFAAGCVAEKGIAPRRLTLNVNQESRGLVREKLHLLGEILVAGNIDLSTLDHRLIAALERLAQVVGGVQEAQLFEVHRFASEKRLRAFVLKEAVHQQEDLLEHFRIACSQGVPFYLRKPRWSFDAAGTNVTEEGQWQEIFGSAWEALSSGLVQICESAEGRPMIELPLLPAPKRKGLFLRLFVRYLEWDHSQDLDSQIGKTLDAMQRGMISLKSESPGYLTVVNSFNSSMQTSGETWADWLIALVPRAWLLYKPSVELAQLITDRAGELLTSSPGVGLSEIGTALSAAWARLGPIESHEEPERWRSLAGRLRKELRGE